MSEDRPELDMPFDEALRRFIRTDPKVLPDKMQAAVKRKAKKTKPSP